MTRDGIIYDSHFQFRESLRHSPDMPPSPARSMPQLPRPWRALGASILLLAALAGAPSLATGAPASPTDASGTRPERLVTLFQGATDTAVALGLKPVGVVESWVEQPMYRYLRPALPNVQYLGLETQPDLESIAWLKPDLIIGARNRHTLIEPLLSRMAPTLIADQLYDFKALLRSMGRATGRDARAQQLLAHWQRRADDFRRKMADQLGDRWPPTVSVISFRSNHARIYYGGFARTVLDDLGFRRPKAQQQPGWGIKLTSQESIPAMDAQAIFIFMVASDEAVMDTYRTWTHHPLWQQLQAARHHDVFRVDPVTWNMGGGYLAANRMLDDLYAHYDLTPFDGEDDSARECPSC